MPRERFLAEVAEREGLERVYQDQAIVTLRDACGIPASSSSQPSMMAAMLEQLGLRRGHRVFEIGAGTGYNAALLARIVGASGEVVSVELDPATARGARGALARVTSAAEVVIGDGREGWPRRAPYDRIVVTASSSTVGSDRGRWRISAELRCATSHALVGSGCSRWRSPSRAGGPSACALSDRRSRCT